MKPRAKRAVRPTHVVQVKRVTPKRVPAKRSRPNPLKCWRCRAEVKKMGDIPNGWEICLTSLHNMRRPKYRHICPRCIID